jgi:hypothetical protein
MPKVLTSSQQHRVLEAICTNKRAKPAVGWRLLHIINEAFRGEKDRIKRMLPIAERSLNQSKNTKNWKTP